MGRFAATFRVAAPPDAALAYLSDYARTVDWDPGTVSCTRLDDGPIAVGSEWENVSSFRGKEATLVYSLVSLTDEGVRFEGTGPGATTFDDFTLAAATVGGTRIDYEAGIDLRSWRRLADPFLRGLYAEMGAGAVAGLTRALS